MKFSYKVKAATMSIPSLTKEFIAVAEAGDSEKLGYLIKTTEKTPYLAKSVAEMVRKSTPEAIAFLIDTFPNMRLMTADIVVDSHKTEMAEAVFPKLLQWKKDSMLYDIVSLAQEEKVAMAQLLVKHGADLAGVLARVEAGYAAEKNEIEQQQSETRSLVTKLKTPSF